MFILDLHEYVQLVVGNNDIEIGAVLQSGRFCIFSEGQQRVFFCQRI